MFGKTPLACPQGETWDEDYQLNQYLTGIQHINNSRHAVDIGAHIGIFTRRFADTFDRVTALEPINYELLCANTQHLDNVRTYEVAASNTNGTMYAHNPGTLTAHTELDYDPSDVEVTTIPVDELKLQWVDYIKIDTQGLELEVIEGASETIHKYKPVIQIETRDYAMLDHICKQLGYATVDRYNKDWILKAL